MQTSDPVLLLNFLHAAKCQ